MACRILCLHGQGVNAQIFSQQTRSFRSLLARECEFTFLDGQMECEAAPGVADVYPKPYLCWYNTPTTTKVTAAQKFVLQYVEKNGPYDGVLGFSQGAALAASILLHHKIEKPDLPPPFSFAIFMGSPIPFSNSLEYGIDTRTYFGSPSLGEVRPNCPTKVPEYLITDPLYLRGEEQLALIEQVGSEGSFGSLEYVDEKKELFVEVAEIKEYFYQMFHPNVDKWRLDIPTGHIFGLQDKWLSHSRDLLKLCQQDRATVFQHIWGHEVPRDASEEICDLVETVISQSEFL